METCSISIIVLTYNSSDLLERLITETEQRINELNDSDFVEFIIVDNASVDGTAALLSCVTFEAKIIFNLNNLGYASGNNAGARIATGEILLFLNDDCFLQPGSLAAILACFRSRPKLGVLQCAIANSDGSAWDTLGHYLDNWGMVHSVSSGVEIGKEEKTDSGSLLGVSGAALAIRSELFLDLDGFDDEMFLLFEETDLCWRAIMKGWEIDVCWEAEAIHLQKARYSHDDISKVRASDLYYETRNRIRAFLKNLESVNCLKMTVVFLVFRFGWSCTQLLLGRTHPLITLVRACRWNVANWNSTMTARRSIQSSRMRTDQDLKKDGRIRKHTDLIELIRKSLHA